MVRRRETFFRRLLIACDALTLVACYAGAYLLRLDMQELGYGPLTTYYGYGWILWVILPAWVFSLGRFGLYRSTSLQSLRGMLVALAKAQTLAALLLLSTMFMTGSAYVSRLFLQTFLTISAVALVAERVGLKFLMDRRNRRLRERKAWRALVVGEQPQVESYLDLLRANPHWPVKVVGTIGPAFFANVTNGARNGTAARQAEARWAELLRSYGADEVVAVCASQDATGFERLAAACAERGVTFRMMVRMPPPPLGAYQVEDLGAGSYLVSLETIPQDPVLMLAKRVFDAVGAIAGLVQCAVVYPFYALWLKWHSPGPILFTQTRLGQNGREFTLYKFRTMYPDAEQRLSELLDRNEMQGPIFKMKNDPRIVPGGRFMRRFHLDELPQFWNVLKGDMSLVGTRPPTPAEADRYRNYHFRRLSIRPGLTGLWQIAGNGEVKNFEDVVRLDCQYIDNWSLWLDAKILAKTSVKALRAQGW